MDFVWNRVLLLLPNWVSMFESEFRLFQDVFKFCSLHMSTSFSILLIFHHVFLTH